MALTRRSHSVALDRFNVCHAKREGPDMADDSVDSMPHRSGSANAWAAQQASKHKASRTTCTHLWHLGLSARTYIASAKLPSCILCIHHLDAKTKLLTQGRANNIKVVRVLEKAAHSQAACRHPGIVAAPHNEHLVKLRQLAQHDDV